MFLCNHLGNKLVSQLSDLSLESQSPSEVCQACLEANGPRALWLSWVKCTNMESHKDMRKITVVVSRKHLVRVHPLPASVTDFGQVKICTSQQVYMDAICFSCSSKRAHSIGELLYWRWQIAMKRIFEKVSLCIIILITLTTMDTLKCGRFLAQPRVHSSRHYLTVKGL